MSVATTDTGVEASLAHKRRRRWPHIALASLVVAVLGFGAYVGWFLSNYQPLAVGSSVLIDPRAQSLGSFTSPHGEGFDAYKVVFQDGEPFGFGLTILNAGPIGVTVTS